MIRYKQRFSKGKQCYVAFLDGVEIAVIYELNTFLNKWTVLKSGCTKGQEFGSLDAAQTFVENTAQMGAI